MPKVRKFSFRCAGDTIDALSFSLGPRGSVESSELGERSAMPSLYGQKTKLRNLLGPVTHAEARAGVIANQGILAAMALSFSGGAAIFHFGSRSVLLPLPSVLFPPRAWDAVDGMLARAPPRAWRCL